MEFSQQSRAGRINPQQRTLLPSPPGYASFEYTGKTALTLIGNVTGMQYRFNYTGNRQNIDYRDVPSIMVIPVLKKVP